jgi:hypothetical protein
MSRQGDLFFPPLLLLAKFIQRLRAVSGRCLVVALSLLFSMASFVFALSLIRCGKNLATKNKVDKSG